MPSANGHSNGYNLVNSNPIVLTNGQTPSSMTSSSTVSPHRHGGPVIASHGHHSNNHSQQSQQAQSNEEVGIREVWAHNLEDEFALIREVVQHYPFVAMDTEFPGVVSKPIGTFTSNSEYLYQIMRCNITMLKIIQIGLTFMNSEGKKPENICTWQFNFRFNLNEDMFAQESIELLTNSGIQFNKHDQEGIDPTEFAVLLIGSGVVLSDNISWLSFHSGYDFGYLLKLLTDQPLPKKESEFFELLKIYFPRVYDLKYLMKSTKDLKGGLQEVAEQLTLVRKGPQHQAGSDSLLTGETFFKLKEMYFENDIEEKRYSGFIYGLETAEIGKMENDEDSSNTGSTSGLYITPGARNINNNNNHHLNNINHNNNNNNNSNSTTISNNNSNCSTTSALTSTSTSSSNSGTTISDSGLDSNSSIEINDNNESPPSNSTGNTNTSTNNNNTNTVTDNRI